MDLSKRSFLRGKFSADRAVQPPRPPWAIKDPLQFTRSCTRCLACVKTCPEKILIEGDGGYPEVRFTQRGCSECQACVNACEPQVLRIKPDETAWRWRPQINENCLSHQHVECRVCGEICDHGAIQFKPRLGGVAQPSIDPSLCSGCGQCLAPCPTRAIAMKDASP